MSLSQVVLRGLLVLASAGLCLVTALSGGPLWPAIVVLAVVTVLAARAPESPFTLALLGLHVVHWLALVPLPTELSGWLLVLLASSLLLVVHLSAAAAVVWPERASVPARAALRWTRRGLAVAAMTVPVWGLTILVDGRALVGDVGLTFAATAAVALLAGALYVTIRDTADR